MRTFLLLTALSFLLLASLCGGLALWNFMSGNPGPGCTCVIGAWCCGSQAILAGDYYLDFERME
jgi:hypothetical protein